MRTYNKLVRDLIPDVIAKAGKTCAIRITEGKEYEIALREKLQEEIKEYLQARTNEQAKEEMADVLEVLFALATAHGSSMEEIEAIRLRKMEERGGFKRGIILCEVKE